MAKYYSSMDNRSNQACLLGKINLQNTLSLP